MRNLMPSRRWLPLTAVLAVLGLLMTTALIGPVTAMESTSFAINWDVVAGGGEPAASTHFALNGTIGQGVTGVASSASYELCSGYWCGAGVRYAIYMPLVLRHS